MSADEFHGGCLCGATRFRVAGPAANRCYCHCRSCRLASGAPFVAWATFPAHGFRLLRGQLTHFRSSERVVRSFCPACGTSITYAHDARPAELDVTLATLDDPSSLEPECHIWLSHALSWVETGDQLPRYATWREGGW